MYYYYSNMSRNHVPTFIIIIFQGLGRIAFFFYSKYVSVEIA